MEIPLYRELWVLSGTKLSKRVEKLLNSDLRSGRAISSTNDQNVEVVRAVMAKHRRLSVRMIVEETGLDKMQFRRILIDHLHMRNVCATLVPKNFSVEQKTNWLEICQDLLRRFVIEPIFWG